MDTQTDVRTERHGQRDTDRETRTERHGQRDTDRETRTERHGQRDTDRETRTERHGQRDADRRTDRRTDKLVAYVVCIKTLTFLLLLCRTLLLPFDIYGQSIKFGAKTFCQLALFPT